MNKPDAEHISVFTPEVIMHMVTKPDGNYVDLTLGASGHTRAILAASRNSNVWAVDADPQAIEKAKEIHDSRLHLILGNFREIAQILPHEIQGSVTGVLADLGWSAAQLEHVPGLSYAGDPAAPLDMRLDASLGVTAADLLNGWHARELQNCLVQFAELPPKIALQLAQRIVEVRKQKLFTTVADLTDLLNGFPAPTAVSRNLTARVFQAFRIAVNQELLSLQSMLPQAWNTLERNGRLLIITFHSLEEKVVQEFARKHAAGAGDLRNLFPESIRPSVAELRRNLRARSAKLWVFEKK